MDQNFSQPLVWFTLPGIIHMDLTANNNNSFVVHHLCFFGYNTPRRWCKWHDTTWQWWWGRDNGWQHDTTKDEYNNATTMWWNHETQPWHAMAMNMTQPQQHTTTVRQWTQCLPSSILHPLPFFIIWFPHHWQWRGTCYSVRKRTQGWTVSAYLSWAPCCHYQMKWHVCWCAALSREGLVPLPELVTWHCDMVLLHDSCSFEVCWGGCGQQG
jgi:hypothetical protein